VHTYINGAADLRIGKGTIIGPYTMIHIANHKIPDKFGHIVDSGFEYAPVNIGKDCWIGGHYCILPGVTIGDHSVIGAGAVVTRDIPEGVIAVGVPARPIKERK
jgi:maltose O-acetyltransferase